MKILNVFDINLMIRIIVACICGIIIGFERFNRAKEAGVRTHCIVACASALMMIISKYGFTDMLAEGLFQGMDVRVDPSRLAQGIVTGVGFLGAGMIYIQRGSIKGLTTASGIWATSGIGMAIGAGMYIVGIFATVIVLTIQYLFHDKIKLMLQHKTRSLYVWDVVEENYQDKITDQLVEIGIIVSDVSVSKNDNKKYDYIFYLDVPEETKEENIVNAIDYRCKIDFVH